jgi:hypothetical protein
MSGAHMDGPRRVEITLHRPTAGAVGSRGGAARIRSRARAPNPALIMDASSAPRSRWRFGQVRVGRTGQRRHVRNPDKPRPGAARYGWNERGGQAARQAAPCTNRGRLFDPPGAASEWRREAIRRCQEAGAGRTRRLRRRVLSPFQARGDPCSSERHKNIHSGIDLLLLNRTCPGWISSGVARRRECDAPLLNVPLGPLDLPVIF